MLALSLATLLAAADVPVVTVLYFDNASGDAELEYMRKGLADLLITDLVAWEGVRIVERNRLEDALKELKFQQTKYIDKSTAAKLGQILGADYQITGTIQKVGAKLALDARLTRVRSSETLITAREVDEPDKIFELEQRLANQLIAKIDGALTPNAQARKKAKVPDAATLLAFSKALELADQGKLEESQAAMRAVVSKAPLFGLARERAEGLSKQFQEYQKLRRDMIVGAIVELAKAVDETLKTEAQFDTFDEDTTNRFLSMRVLKGRYLARVLKQYLSKRGSPRLVLPGKEGQALLAMRDWVENQRKLLSEVERASRRLAKVYPNVTVAFTPRFSATDEHLKLIKASQIGDDFDSQPLMTLLRFAFEGRIDDGESFYVAPLFASVDPKEGAALRAQLDKAVDKGLAAAAANDRFAENEVRSLLGFKADVALSRGDIEGAIVAKQAMLDAFPTNANNASLEQDIKKLLAGEGGYTLKKFQDYEEALKTCDSMKINLSSMILEERIRTGGLDAYEKVTGDLEKACKPSNANKSMYQIFYSRIAHTAAEGEDCVRYRRYYQRYLELGGSTSEMLAHAKNMPWCDLGELKNDLTVLSARYDNGTRDLAMERRAVSILSYDGKVLSISGSREPLMKGENEESFDLRLEKQADGKFKCVQARWRQHWSQKYSEGTCTVTIKSLAEPNAPGFDEGTFEALLPKVDRGGGTIPQDVKFIDGHFRTRRE